MLIIHSPIFLLDFFFMILDNIYLKLNMLCYLPEEFKNIIPFVSTKNIIIIIYWLILYYAYMPCIQLNLKIELILFKTIKKIYIISKIWLNYYIIVKKKKMLKIIMPSFTFLKTVNYSCFDFLEWWAFFILKSNFPRFWNM